MKWADLPPLNALRAFAAVAETLNLSHAAKVLNVTHPAISRQIRNLEEHLGTQLVLRKGRGVTLTSQGAALAVTLNASFANISSAIEALGKAEASRSLQVSMTPMFATGFLMPRITEFCTRHPEIELMLNPQIEVVELAPGGIDMTIRYGTGKWKGLQSELLFLGCLTVVASRSLIGKRKITEPSELLEYPLLQEFGSEEFANWFEKRGVDKTIRRNVVHMPGNMLLEGARHGDGIVATVPRFIESELRSGELVELFRDPIPGIGYYIVTRPGVRRKPLQDFITWLHAISKS
ncbi:HTH-type transcriptional activator AmpR [Roseovarius litorisediminis]|uniref:HTH-type transcriptional activator AmpR n=1 Tax=Roseovarius litorisediminis TaxID=1312363 RepID=A0A1Y5S0Z6_9RHOB|nr:LysR family transcriptional regulator [Roseovarius litorisediminis]SLN29882.1 HTH-type transcriptional activator AmpR [Roseovarius litorisediminis]